MLHYGIDGIGLWHFGKEKINIESQFPSHNASLLSRAGSRPNARAGKFVVTAGN